MNFQVTPLCQRRDLITPVAQLFEQTWPEYYGPDGAGDAAQDLSDRCCTTGLPMAVVAHQGDDRVMGSGTLAQLSYGANEGEEPWITGLCVPIQARNKRIASEIVAALASYAARQGHRHVYATTISAHGLLTRFGFQPIREIADAKGVWTILRMEISCRKARSN